MFNTVVGCLWLIYVCKLCTFDYMFMFVCMCVCMLWLVGTWVWVGVALMYMFMFHSEKNVYSWNLRSHVFPVLSSAFQCFLALLPLDRIYSSEGRCSCFSARFRAIQWWWWCSSINSSLFSSLSLLKLEVTVYLLFHLLPFSSLSLRQLFWIQLL